MTRVPFHAIVRSEWTKLRTSRAMTMTALGAAMVTLALTALHCVNAPTGRIDTVGASLFGITVAQFVAGVCGALAVTSEYSSNTIRITLIATPWRSRLFASKIALLAVAAFGYGALVSAAALVLGRSLLGASHANTGDPLVTLRRIAGAAAVLTAMTLLGAAAGYLARHSAGAIVAMLSVLVLPKLLGNALPASEGAHVLRYVPLSAADSLVSLPGPGVLPPLAALAVLTAEIGAVVLMALLAFDRRDA